MSKIFFSYRRQDSAGVAGRIYDRLRTHFGDGAIFMDVDSIPFGSDFRAHISSALDQCGVLLAVIGDRWIGQPGAPRRIDDERDFVRIEIESALVRNLPVIPILINRASMPGPEDLPPPLALLAYRHAIEVDHGRDFHHHVDQLIKSIERVLLQPGGGTIPALDPRERPDEITELALNTHGSAGSALLALAPPKRRNVPLWVSLSLLAPFAIFAVVACISRDKGAFTITGTRETGSHAAGAIDLSRSDRSTTSGQPAPPRQPLKEWTNSIGMKFVGIEPGEFMMGSPNTDVDDRADEKPQHLVRITRRFYLGIHEVTQSQFQKVMSENPSKHKGSELPVYHLSWLDAVQLCNRLSELETRNPCYRIDGETVTMSDGNGYRLPTEAEWEYACRAGSTTDYCFGDDDSQLGEFAWFGGNSGNAPHPVGQKRPNAFGLHDMHGNVWEWCWDAYAGNYYSQSPVEDPSGPAKSLTRVFRGGNWGSGREPRPHRSAKRGWNGPQITYGGVGIRLALNDPPQS